MIETLQKFISQIVLADVFLKSQGGQSFVLPAAIDPVKVSLDLDFKSRFERIDAKVFISYISLTVFAKAMEDKDDKKFEIMTEQALVYDYSQYDGGEVTDEMLLEFSKTNAIFNAYPYLRESVHTLSCKMGIPPVLAPLYKPNFIKSADAEKEVSPVKVKKKA